jgi:hypothetical protein
MYGRRPAQLREPTRSDEGDEGDEKNSIGPTLALTHSAI